MLGRELGEVMMRRVFFFFWKNCTSAAASSGYLVLEKAIYLLHACQLDASRVYTTSYMHSNMRFGGNSLLHNSILPCGLKEKSFFLRLHYRVDAL